MSLKTTVKNATISSGIYGPTKRLHRRLFDKAALRRFQGIVALYDQFVKPGDLCFDVGSNIGTRTEAFLALGARVVAFEPQPHVYREMMARCSPSLRLTGVQAAVGASPGELPMYVSNWSPISSLLPEWVEGSLAEVIQVKVTTLDHAIEKYGTPQFCKIDVEGYELEALNGLSHRLPALSIEYNLTEKGIQKIFDCLDNLSQYGTLRMNVTRCEEPHLLWPEWVSHDAFRKHFPSAIPPSHEAKTLPQWVDFGDVFVRIDN